MYNIITLYIQVNTLYKVKYDVIVGRKRNLVEGLVNWYFKN